MDEILEVCEGTLLVITSCPKISPSFDRGSSFPYLSLVSEASFPRHLSPPQFPWTAMIPSHIPCLGPDSFFSTISGPPFCQTKEMIMSRGDEEVMKRWWRGELSMMSWKRNGQRYPDPSAVLTALYNPCVSHSPTWLGCRTRRLILVVSVSVVLIGWLPTLIASSFSVIS